MAKVVKRTTIETNLQKKGFREDGSKRDHRFYHFWHNGKATIARTKISMGSDYKDYGDNLLQKMSKQLKFQKTGDLVDFVKCKKSEADYIDILRAQKIIS